jgi:hypothetical protein
MLPTKNYLDRPKTKSYRVNEDNSGGDANVKLCIQHFLSPGFNPTPLGNLFKKM